jgi:ubiquinone/menaquinone biosynthesis C-methylase UbiE
VLRALVTRLAAWPSIFDLLRYLLEGGYRGHRSVWENELRSQPGKVLDIGCGTGIHAQHFSADAYTGIDISDDYVSAAIRKYPGYQFFASDATKLPFESNIYCTAMISGVLHHLSDEEAQRLLSEAARVLQPDGTLVVWEDIPSRSRWNLIGHLIHRLDLGQHIRPPDGYRRLLELHFDLRSTRIFRSGFMDYAVFQCMLRNHSDC